MPASIFNGTAVKLLKNILKFKDGTTLSSTIAAYLANITSDVQAQLDARALIDEERTVYWNDTDFATLQAGIDYCETLAGAAFADTKGVVLVVPSRNFAEDVVIRKNVSLQGEGFATVQKITYRSTSATTSVQRSKLTGLIVGTLEAYAETAAASGIFDPDFLTLLSVENCMLAGAGNVFNRANTIIFKNCDLEGSVNTATYCNTVIFLSCRVGGIEWHVDDSASNLPTAYAGGTLNIQNSWVPGTVNLYKDGGSITAYLLSQNSHFYELIMNGDCEVRAEGSRITTLTRLNSNNTFLNNEEYGLYKPATPANWLVEPEKVNDALDELASRVADEVTEFASGDAANPSISHTGDLNTGFFFPSNDAIGASTAGVERYRIASDGSQSAVVPGGSTLLPVFPVRAWTSFDGATLSTVSGTYSRTGTTVTVTVTAHGHQVGHYVFLDFTSGAATDGGFVVATVIDANNFTITHGTSGSTSGNVNLNRLTISGSGNVHSVYRRGTGLYALNFSTFMPDTNYAVLASTPGTTSDMNNTLTGGFAEAAGHAFGASQNPNDGVNANVAMQMIVIR